MWDPTRHVPSASTTTADEVSSGRATTSKPIVAGCANLNWCVSKKDRFSYWVVQNNLPIASSIIGLMGPFEDVGKDILEPTLDAADIC